MLPGDSAGVDIQTLPVDLAANARSLGAHVIECQSYTDFVSALKDVQHTDRTSVIYIQNDRYVEVPDYNSWWDVPVAEVSTNPQVEAARTRWETKRTQERYFLNPLQTNGVQDHYPPDPLQSINAQDHFPPDPLQSRGADLSRTDRLQPENRLLSPPTTPNVPSYSESLKTHKD